MPEFELGSIVAERKLTIEGNPSTVITVLMGMPQKVPSKCGDDFVCPIQILGYGNEKVRGVFGVDEFQAIQLGMQFIGVELYVKLNKKFEGKIRWNNEIDLGFPLPDSVIEFGPG